MATAFCAARELRKGMKELPMTWDALWFSRTTRATWLTTGIADAGVGDGPGEGEGAGIAPLKVVRPPQPARAIAKMKTAVRSAFAKRISKNLLACAPVPAEVFCVCSERFRCRGSRVESCRRPRISQW